MATRTKKRPDPVAEKIYQDSDGDGVPDAFHQRPGFVDKMNQRAAVEQQTQAEKIANIPIRVPAFGKVYEIKRFSMGQAFRSLEYVGPYGFLLQQVMELPRDKKGKVVASEDQLLRLAVSVITMSGPSGLGLVSVATNEPPEWLEEQEDTMGGFRILAAVLEKNLDFFSPANIAELTRMFDGLQHAVLNYGGNTSATS